MTRHLRASAIAIAISAGWALPAQARADDAAIQQELAAMRAEMARMAQRIDTLETQLVTARADANAAQAKADAAATALAALPAQTAPTVTAKPATEVTWEGAPKLATKDGWSFKPRGRLHIDAGTISTPGALVAPSLGGAVRVRRARLGFDGTIPGGLGYKAEIDFANGGVSYGDVLVSYSPAKIPMQVRVGNFESLNSMEQISSSNFNTFIERASFNDAFLNTRRLGMALAFRGKQDDWRAEAGIFAAHGIDASLDNNGWIGAARLVYAPKALGGQLHFGVNFQHRSFASNISGGTSSGTGMPSVNQLARYRARPNSQLTDLRFVDTGNFAAKSDRLIGIEAAAIFKRFYLAGEAQWLRTNAFAPGSIAIGKDAFSGGNVAVTPIEDPGFFGGYGEVGFFVTGETRGYRRGEGTWARTKVLSPISKGGMGAIHLAFRFEHLDLQDDALTGGLSNNFANGLGTLAPAASRLGRGGRQSSYLFALNWHPSDYVRFMVDYGIVDVTGGPLAEQVAPLSTLPVSQRSYKVNVLQTRLQFDF